jgi:hypothetical protein
MVHGKPLHRRLLSAVFMGVRIIMPILSKQDGNTNNFDDSQWRNVVKVDGIPELNAQMAEPLKIMQELKPQSKKQLANGIWVYDLGQNFSGIPQISVQGKKGDTVKIIPAELVNEDGSANQKASGSPHYYTYVLKGNGVETWHPCSLIMVSGICRCRAPFLKIEPILSNCP